MCIRDRIEILRYRRTIRWRVVALLAEGVDRNHYTACVEKAGPGVALLAEGVDRNSLRIVKPPVLWVALLAEGVDRNYFGKYQTKVYNGSPSSRRAWIEICTVRAAPQASMSPSSRRAWIEICREAGGT